MINRLHSNSWSIRNKALARLTREPRCASEKISVSTFCGGTHHPISLVVFQARCMCAYLHDFVSEKRPVLNFFASYEEGVLLQGF